MADGKKNILYVSEEFSYNHFIVTGLGGRYTVSTVFCEPLDQVPEMLSRGNPPGHKYDALITSVPKNPLTNSCAHSIKVILDVRKKFKDLPVVAYVRNCTDSWMIGCERSIDKIVYNTGRDSHAQDAEQVREALDFVFAESKNEM
jgi:hypothetical protein